MAEHLQNIDLDLWEGVVEPDITVSGSTVISNCLKCSMCYTIGSTPCLPQNGSSSTFYSRGKLALEHSYDMFPSTSSNDGLEHLPLLFTIKSPI